MKRSLLALTLFISIAAGIFLAAKNIKLFEVNAAGSHNVTVTQGDWVYWKPDSGFGTPRLNIAPGDYLAYCIDPATPAPSGEFDTIALDDNSGNNRLIKLAIYIASAGTTATNGIMDTWFNRSNIDTAYWDNTDPNEYVNTSTDAGMEDFKYVFMHIVVGYLNHEGEQGMETRIATYLSAKDKTLLNTIIDSLKSYVPSSSNPSGSDIWLIAKNYSLFNIVKPVSENIQNIAWIENDPESGSIKVQKCDEETGSCTTPQGAANFSGIKFEVYNTSGNRIYIPSKNQFYDNNALIASGTTGTDGSVIFSGLPLDTLYRVEEVDTNNSYLITATPQTTTLVADGSTKNLNFFNDVIRGDVKFTKTSDVDGEPMANVVFKIKSTSGAKEEHLVVTDENGVVDTSASHASHKFHTNGYDNMEEDEIGYLAYGTWFGGGTADDARGALPYDTYEITEMQCDANKFCYDIGSTKKTFTIKTDGEVVDLKEWSNDCADFSLTTTATDNSDGDKILAYNQDVEIKDVVDYCLKKDMEFTIRGVVMNKNTKEPLLIDGKKVEQAITFTPDSTCGTTEMIYSLNTKDLGGVDLVIFEDLYYGDELILSHSDFENANQTVSVAPPTPDTGMVTKTTSGSSMSDNIVMIVFVASSSISLYVGARSLSRRKFLNRKR